MTGSDSLSLIVTVVVFGGTVNVDELCDYRDPETSQGDSQRAARYAELAKGE